MIWEDWDPFQKNKREALINKNGTQTSGRWNPTNFVPKVRFLVVSGCDKNIVKTSLFTGEKRWKSRFWSKTLKLYRARSEQVSGQVFLLQIWTLLGLAAIFLTANALCSPVRKENPASRACGNKKPEQASVKMDHSRTVSYTHLTLPTTPYV